MANLKLFTILLKKTNPKIKKIYVKNIKNLNFPKDISLKNFKIKINFKNENNKTKFKIIKSKIYKDKRGSLKEIFKSKDYNKKFKFFLLVSSKKNVFRGFHFQ